MADVVLESFPLGAQWPTVDPFLFCAHHLDHYPAGDGALAPAASLQGRQIGSDFSGIDGWSMYHGSRVPGFPSHPHRGFETVTYLRSGLCDHTDSLGSAARFGVGDTQWLTAGAGVVHAEMFPLVHTDEPNPLELFQIWLNLPAANNMVDPYFTMLWGHDTPCLHHVDAEGQAFEVTVIAGRLAALEPPTPPPDSWAAAADSDVAIWHISATAGATWTLPVAAEGTIRTLYVFDGTSLTVGGSTVDAGTGAVIRCDEEFTVVAGTGPVDALVLQGRPLGEPVARYGPFVMNTEAEIEQAFADYRATGFGGWPWPSDDPDHADQGRFARHADGTLVEP